MKRGTSDVIAFVMFLLVVATLLTLCSVAVRGQGVPPRPTPAPLTPQAWLPMVVSNPLPAPCCMVTPGPGGNNGE